MSLISGKEPPVAHASQSWDASTRSLNYDYNGSRLLSMSIPEGVKPYYREVSNGNIQSSPLVQQLYLGLDKPAAIKVIVYLSKEAINMRPNRAMRGQAILGQVGKPLLFGVNGLYDVLQDLLIDWHGAGWQWTKSRLELNEDGNWQAELEIEGGLRPWIVNLRMHYYRMHLHYEYHKPWQWRPQLQPITGWSSWEAFAQQVTGEDIEHTASFLETHFKPYGLTHMQIDDGFQREAIPPEREGIVADAWLQTNERFPDGHDGIISSIVGRDFQAGIWTSAMVTNPEFVAAHRDRFERDINGDPLYGQWIEYVIKAVPETLAEQVAPLYKGLKEIGYSYFKTDQIRHYLYEGLHKAVHEGSITSEEASRSLRAYLQCAREQLGEDAYFLACWGVLTEAVGIVDACRIAGDSNASWTAICKQMVETARWYHTQRILFLNDPDYICVRTEKDWGQTLLSLVSLTGGLMIISDNTDLYDSERIRSIQRCIPSLPTMTGETGPLDMTFPLDLSFPQQNASQTREEYAYAILGLNDGMREPYVTASLWAIHFDLPFRRWCVAGRFAIVPLTEVELELEALALDPSDAYHAFDFWKQSYMGKFSIAIALEPLELGACQIVGLSKAENRPQLIGSSRHVSMDAVSVLDECWDNNRLQLELCGARGMTELYWIKVPASYTLEEHSGIGLAITIEDSACEEGWLLTLCIRFEAERGKVFLSFKT
ncbi:hypothetical protein BK120_11835 [Paenibacillus sp. FSL A5-0031]|uniref:hypothetical protein n=1 Tax=Paenibacillus sp. FSL A5-0031 TaxID=1920420 RepID=UPI00096EFA99|nr:hypothetical protein [Paenibacillus sp. FSL A5-0031]OME85210.1 hypothetical protein BK120_11835 [Paenibacillus sp. FSL A5-0031]